MATLVKPQWLAGVLKSQAQSANVRILDASWHMPHTQRSGAKEYLEEHIPASQYFDIDACADTQSPYGHMLPSPEKFSSYVGNLGIGNDTHVVVYDNNDLGLFSSQRAWWMFRIFGHSLVSILDGGLPAWKRDRLELTKDVEKVTPKSFHVQYNSALYRTFEQVSHNLSNSQFKLVDARAPGRFSGTAPEPRQGVYT